MRPRHRLVRSLDTRICCPAETRTFRPCGKSIPELDESVTNAIEIRQMQQAEFVTAAIASVRDIKESLQEMKSGRHIRSKPCTSRPMIPARRPSSFIRVCEVVYIAGDVDEKSEALSCRTS